MGNEKVYIKGNYAIVEAALKAGLNGFFGYPITPASEITEGLAKVYFEDLERAKKGEQKKYPDFEIFMQMESEIASINAVLGGAATGKRVMTASSSPGISLKEEGISYIAGCELPAVIINAMRAGPGLGGIAPEQGDYFQATKGGGHGDYRVIVLAPSTIQELADFTFKLFNLTDKYRNPGMLLYDGYLGQMKEGIIFPETNVEKVDKSSWVADGNKKGREKHVINSLYIDPDVLEVHKHKLQKKYKAIEDNEKMAECYMVEDADIVIAAYGTVARISRDIVDRARENGIKTGLVRPITLWPFPSETISKIADNSKAFLTAEMSLGQMVEDVRLAVNGKVPVEFYGRVGGNMPDEDEILKKVVEMNKRFR